MENYAPNSKKFKEEQKAELEEKKKIDKVVNGPVKIKKKNEISKFKEVFISEDIANVKSYVVMDVLIPAVKKAISDIITNGIDMILYGDSGRNRRSSGASKVSYRDYYDRGRDRRDEPTRSRTGYSYDEIIIDSRGEAEEVLNRMDELIETYGIVSVADLYDLVGETCDYTANKYGWTNIRNSEPVRVRDGYILKLPKPLPIK